MGKIHNREKPTPAQVDAYRCNTFTLQCTESLNLIYFIDENLKNLHSKVGFSKIVEIFIIDLAPLTDKKVKFVFSNVAYRTTVYKNWVLCAFLGARHTCKKTLECVIK